MTWHGVAWRGVAWRGVVWCGAWYGIIAFNISKIVLTVLMYCKMYHSERFSHSDQNGMNLSGYHSLEKNCCSPILIDLLHRMFSAQPLLTTQT